VVVVVVMNVPEDPPLSIPLKRLHLRLNIPPRIILELLIPRLDEIHIRAAPHILAPRIQSLVPRSNPVPIQRRCAIGHRGRPLADEGPLVGARVRVRVVADVLAMLPGGHFDEGGREDLVFVVVGGWKPSWMTTTRVEEISRCWL